MLDTGSISTLKWILPVSDTTPTSSLFLIGSVTWVHTPNSIYSCSDLHITLEIAALKDGF